jgi:hypothetical protein
MVRKYGKCKGARIGLAMQKGRCKMLDETERDEIGDAKGERKPDALMAKWAFQSYIGGSGVDRGGFPFGKLVN